MIHCLCQRIGCWRYKACLANPQQLNTLTKAQRISTYCIGFNHHHLGYKMMTKNPEKGRRLIMLHKFVILFRQQLRTVSSTKLWDIKGFLPCFYRLLKKSPLTFKSCESRPGIRLTQASFKQIKELFSIITTSITTTLQTQFSSRNSGEEPFSKVLSQHRVWCKKMKTH